LEEWSSNKLQKLEKKVFGFEDYYTKYPRNCSEMIPLLQILLQIQHLTSQDYRGFGT